jgi:hypothetical protein
VQFPSLVLMIQILPITTTEIEWVNWYSNLPIDPSFIFKLSSIKFSDYAKVLITLEYLRTHKTEPVALLKNCHYKTMSFLHFHYLVYGDVNLAEHSELTVVRQQVSGTLKDFYEAITTVPNYASEQYHRFCNQVQMDLEYCGLQLLFDKYEKKSKNRYWTLELK